MPNAELASAIRQAQVTKMFFVFIPKGRDGKLIASRKKIHPWEIEKARKEIGGGKILKGTFFGPINDMVFQVAKLAPATLEAVALGATLKKVIMRDTGLNIVARVELKPDLGADDEPELGDE